MGEGKAAYNNILLDKQILANPDNTGTGITIALELDPTKTAAEVNTITAQGMTQDQAVLYLAGVFSGLTTSVNGQNYIQYYAQAGVNYPQYTGVDISDVTAISFASAATRG